MVDFEIAAVGDNCIDRFTGAANFSLVGGNAVNVAVQLSRLGRRAAYFGAVGNDAAGRRVLDGLARNRVDTGFVRIENGVTAYTEVERNETGDRRFVFEEFGVVKDYRPNTEEMEVLAKTRLVHIGWLNDGGAVRRTMHERMVSVSQDISVNAEARNLEVAALDIAFASLDGPLEEAIRLGARLIASGAKLAVITRGAQGSLATDGQSYTEIKAVHITAVDTTGAGDAFIAGFLDGRLKALPLGQCLENGRDAATDACLHLGGFRQPLIAMGGDPRDCVKQRSN